jgi:hypothetical protein
MRALRQLEQDDLEETTADTLEPTQEDNKEPTITKKRPRLEELDLNSPDTCPYCQKTFDQMIIEKHKVRCIPQTQPRNRGLIQTTLRYHNEV